MYDLKKQTVHYGLQEYPLRAKLPESIENKDSIDLQEVMKAAGQACHWFKLDSYKATAKVETRERIEIDGKLFCKEAVIVSANGLYIEWERR